MPIFPEIEDYVTPGPSLITQKPRSNLCVHTCADISAILIAKLSNLTLSVNLNTWPNTLLNYLVNGAAYCSLNAPAVLGTFWKGTSVNIAEFPFFVIGSLERIFNITITINGPNKIGNYTTRGNDAKILNFNAAEYTTQIVPEKTYNVIHEHVILHGLALFEFSNRGSKHVNLACGYEDTPKSITLYDPSSDPINRTWGFLKSAKNRNVAQRLQRADGSFWGLTNIMLVSCKIGNGNTQCGCQ